MFCTIMCYKKEINHALQGTFAFAWNFVMWIPTIIAPDGLLLYIGIVDAMIVSALIAATSIEGTYVGKTKHECGQVSPYASANSSLVFFDRAGTINMTNTDYGKDLCNNFLTTYYVGIVIM